MKKTLFALFCVLSVAGVATGCKSEDRIIDHVTFKPSDNLEVVRVSVVFTQKIKSDLAGGFALKDYGYLFINPYTPAQPFEVGFDLNTAIVNDQDYIRIEPTTVLPNGVPIGIDHALVEVHAPKPISDKFDLFGYVDVLQAKWLGASTMFSFLIDKYFPQGLTLSQVLWRDKDGNAGVIGDVFGPSATRNGGIALFANVRALITEHKLQAGMTTTFYPGKGDKMELSGPSAEYYRQHPNELRRLRDDFINGLNQP